MAEWLRRGLQILARRFDSGSGLHTRRCAQVTDPSTPRSPLRTLRLVLWALVALAAAGAAYLALADRRPDAPKAAPFTLTGGDGQPWSSARLDGRPHVIFFGFTRCGDVCPTTLGRLAALRRQVGGDKAFDILFVTIDPAHDGPREVGQYAKLFDTPIIGLTGSQPAIDAVKKSYGIHAEPTPHAGRGRELAHTSSVLLFDREGRAAGTIMASDDDAAALAKLKAIAA
jgi:protein SCO1/2